MKIKNKSYDDLVKEYRKLAKRADQRLVRLEGQRHHKKYENILEYSYKTAIKDIRSWAPKGQKRKAKRFNTEPPKNVEDLVAKISDIQKFLNSPTSSVKRINKQTASLNQTFFGNDKKKYLNWEEYANFFEKNDADNTDSRFEYYMLVRCGGIIKQYDIDETNVKEKLEQFQRSGDIDKVEARIIESMMEEGLTFDKLFKK